MLSIEQQVRERFRAKGWKLAENTLRMYKRFTFNSHKPCRICSKPNSPIHLPMIAGGLPSIDYIHAMDALCWECFDEVWAGEY